MSLRDQIKRAVEQGELGEIERLLAGDPRALRHIFGLTYHADDEIRRTACRGIAIAARHHRRLVQDLVRRLVWAMNEESATNALTAPEVIAAIADEQPDLLLPMVPDLIRLAADDGLNAGLSDALRQVSDRCPGKVGSRLQRSLNERLGAGESDDI